MKLPQGPSICLKLQNNKAKINQKKKILFQRANDGYAATFTRCTNGTKRRLQRLKFWQILDERSSWNLA